LASAAAASPLILVHGAWHDGSCWSAVAGALAARGLDVSHPDLPGHGRNALPLPKVSHKQYVNFLLQQLEAAPAPVILVGHSMAGMAVTHAACQMPHKVRRLVYLCAYLPRPGESVFELIALNRGHEPLTPIELALELSADKRSCAIDPEQIDILFHSDLAQAQALPRFPPQATLPLSAGARFEQAAFVALDTAYICCTRDRVIPLHHQRRMLARQPCHTLLQMEADHSPFHSCPQALSDLLHALAQLP
jgi:pimeloyl-ACP methyl ester carboxylesterase